MMKKFERAHAASDAFAEAMVREAQSDADATLQATLKKEKQQANRKVKAVKKAAKKKLKHALKQLIKQQGGTVKQALKLTAAVAPPKPAVEPTVKPVLKAAAKVASPAKPEPASTVVPAVPPSNNKAVTKAPAMISVKKAIAHPAAKETDHQQKPSGLTYMGCFSDRLDDRDLSSYHGQVATPEQCGASCEALNKGYRYAGIQNGDQCFCGVSYGRHGNEPAATCFKQCSGAHGELCGGVHRNSVYRLQ